MEKTMTHYKERDIYYLDDFNVLKNKNISDLNNKLFCTFTDQEGLDPLLENIQRSYSIMYNKIFVLYVTGPFELSLGTGFQIYTPMRVIYIYIYIKQQFFSY